MWISLTQTLPDNKYITEQLSAGPTLLHRHCSVAQMGKGRYCPEKIWRISKGDTMASAFMYVGVTDVAVQGNQYDDIS